MKHLIQPRCKVSQGGHQAQLLHHYLTVSSPVDQLCNIQLQSGISHALDKLSQTNQIESIQERALHAYNIQLCM